MEADNEWYGIGSLLRFDMDGLQHGRPSIL